MTKKLEVRPHHENPNAVTIQVGVGGQAALIHLTRKGAQCVALKLLEGSNTSQVEAMLLVAGLSQPGEVN